MQNGPGCKLTLSDLYPEPWYRPELLLCCSTSKYHTYNSSSCHTQKEATHLLMHSLHHPTFQTRRFLLLWGRCFCMITHLQRSSPVVKGGCTSRWWSAAGRVLLFQPSLCQCRTTIHLLASILRIGYMITGPPFSLYLVCIINISIHQ